MSLFSLNFLTVRERLLLGGVLLALIWGGAGFYLSGRSRREESPETGSLYRQLRRSLEETPPRVSLRNPREPDENDPAPARLTYPPAGNISVGGTIPGKININRADRETLISLPGVGPVTARRIIEYRRLHGGFSSWKSLKKVKGLGEKKVEKLKDYVVFY